MRRRLEKKIKALIIEELRTQRLVKQYSVHGGVQSSRLDKLENRVARVVSKLEDHSMLPTQVVHLDRRANPNRPDRRESTHVALDPRPTPLGSSADAG